MVVNETIIYRLLSSYSDDIEFEKLNSKQERYKLNFDNGTSLILMINMGSPMKADIYETDKLYMEDGYPVYRFITQFVEEKDKQFFTSLMVLVGNLSDRLKARYKEA